MRETSVVLGGVIDQGSLRGNYIARHWRGDISLGVSYWINGGLLGNLVPRLLVGASSAYIDEEGQNLRLVAALSVGTLVFCLATYLWGVVGIWRAAEKHTQRGGRAFWAGAARVAVVLGMLSAAMSLSQGNLGRQLLELSEIAIGQDSMAKIDVKISPDGRSALLVGTLGTGSAEKVKQIIDSASGVRVISLNSPGGRLLEAKEIGAYVRRRSLDTYVEGRCESACTLVFLAGSSRGATPNAKIGFHRASFAGEDSKDLSGADPMMAFYRSSGISEAFLSRVINTSSTSMWYPTRDELIANHVVTRVSLGGETTSDLGSQGIDSLADLANEIKKEPLFASIDSRFPGSADRAAAAAWSAKQHGANDEQLMTAARGVIADLVPKALATAPDEILGQFLAVIRAELAASLAVSPEACGKLLNSQLDIAQTLPADVVKQDRAFTQALFEASARFEPPLNKAEAGPYLTPALRTLRPEQLKVLFAPNDFADHPRTLCLSFIAYYGAIASLPTPERRLALRAAFQTEH